MDTATETPPFEQVCWSDAYSQTPDAKLEDFSAHCKRFFDSVLYNLDIGVFTRVGLRTFHRKDFAALDDGKAALAALDLVNLKSIERFGAASETPEIMVRWEGSLFRLSWKWRERSSVKIAERTYEKRAQALHC